MPGFGIKTEYFSNRIIYLIKGIFRANNHGEVIMRKLIIYGVAALFFLICSISACSKSGNDDSEKGKIETTVDKVADDSVKGINSALDKARAVSRKAEKNVDELDETLDE